MQRAPQHHLSLSTEKKPRMRRRIVDNDIRKQQHSNIGTYHGWIDLENFEETQAFVIDYGRAQ
ncbi:CLUMA_CG019276, isoform A [Clunio marinus]|uniref:CLUMA_CG019276, isoform A n=1 Tax=Clunio marinus TaxID=568069 RepID=A0A1J1J5E3_9DIPT|nr:CLUMA_CG019276, isoform A [Clunio marinus]